MMTESTSRGHRINYIDNLRWICVFLLIPYHAAMSYNIWGEDFYIIFEPNKPISAIVLFCSPWIMPLMFLLAGVSAGFSLKKRGYLGFIKERFIKLGITLILGVLLITPVLSYFADVSHNGYIGNYFEHYKVFFTRITDLSGYDGGFAVAHLWFILVLIIISIEACLVIKIVEIIPLKKRAGLGLICFIVLTLTAIAAFKIRLFGEPVHTYFCMFLLGYYFYSNKNFVEKLKKLKWFVLPIFLISAALYVYLVEYTEGFYQLTTVCNYLAFIFGVPALFCSGSLWFDFRNDVTGFFSEISYLYYIIHFPILLFCQYTLDQIGMNHTGNFFVTILLAVPITLTLCIMYKRIKRHLARK
jgi:peptidoglycan/LPS O-acetylase OafA/YrhL